VNARGPHPPVPSSGQRRTFTLTYTLALAAFRVKYLDSTLSYAWAVLRPLLWFGILYAVFTYVGRFDNGVKNYGLYLFAALVLWIFFADATTSAVRCLVGRGTLLRKVPLPHLVVPLSVVLTAAFDLVMNLVAVFVLMFVVGVTPQAGWLELPLLLLLLMMLATGFATLLSALYVRYRDIYDVWQLLRQFFFFGSPIFYVVSALPDNAERIAMVNPLGAIFTEMRHALIDPNAPTAAAAIGGTARLLVPLGATFVVLALGLWVFRRESPRVPERS
jgi:ABC-2 type transport system permease protein